MKKYILVALLVIATLLLIGCEDSNEVSSSTAIVMAQEFVKQHLRYPSSAEFDFWSREATSCGDNCWIVIGRGTAQNAFGTRIEFTYKTKITYTGGDRFSESNWDVDYCNVYEE